MTDLKSLQFRHCCLHTAEEKMGFVAEFPEFLNGSVVVDVGVVVLV